MGDEDGLASDWDVEPIVVSLPRIAIPVIGQDLSCDESHEAIEVQHLLQALLSLAERRLGGLNETLEVVAVLRPIAGILLELVGDILQEPAVVEVAPFPLY